MHHLSTSYPIERATKHDLSFNICKVLVISSTLTFGFTEVSVLTETWNCNGLISLFLPLFPSNVTTFGFTFKSQVLHPVAQCIC